MTTVEMTDEEHLLRDIIYERWDESMLPLPQFYYDDSFKTVDGKNIFIKIYYMSSPQIQPIGLGYGRKKVDFNLVVDIRGGSRDKVLKARDEVVRILDAVNTRPKRATDTASNYDYLVYSTGDKINAFSDFYRWEMYVTLKQLAKTVGGI